MMIVLTKSQTSIINVVTQGLSVEEYTAELSQQETWVERFTQKDKRVHHLFTFYYPYYFSEWKVTVPRYLFREGKALIRIGVNGLTGLAAQTELWPEYSMQEAENKKIIRFKVSKAEIDVECKRSLENYVYKAMRPLKPPKYELNREEMLYLPYYVFLIEESTSKKAYVIEALTGTKAPVNKLREIKGWLAQEIKKYVLL